MSEATTDLELLKLAAKAAGIEFDAKASEPHPKSGAFFGLWLVIRGEPYEGQRRYWNPLADDGDAFRLATTLRLSVSHFNDASQPHPWLRIEDRNGVWTHAGPSPEFNADPLAETRRAITRAAAAIGKEMK